MFSSLRSRLWLSYALLVFTALSVVAVVLFVYLIRNPLLYRQTLERLQVVQTVLENREGQSLSMAAKRVARNFNVRIIQFAENGVVLLDTGEGRESPIALPRDTVRTRSIPLVRDAKNSLWIYSIEQLDDNSKLLVASPRPRISLTNVFADDFLPLIMQSGVIALLLSLGVAFFVARWIADPLQKVVLAAGRMPSPDAGPVDVSGPHEVQELTRAFNDMIDRTQASQRSQREFVANVSHELKTPLTSVQGFAQALLDGTAESEDARRQAAQIIYDEAGRMHRMVLDLLDLARLDSRTADLKIESVSLPALLNAVVGKFQPQSQQAGVSVRVNAAEGTPPVPGDGDRLAQVFTNLVDNALKFTPAGGQVLLSISPKANEVIVAVSDSGQGIPEAVLPHIFDRFYQADPARGGGEKHGAGLGLAIVKEIIQAHGGRISVRSRTGQGSTFEIALPLSAK